MHARQIRCRVIQNETVSPEVIRLKFDPSDLFAFKPGQFISVAVPSEKGRPLFRPYSLANSQEEAVRNGYELCIKTLRQGRGSQYMKSLQPGQVFQARAPFGDFQFVPPASGRLACFIGTGTGMAPLWAMASSKLFQRSRPSGVLCLAGFREASDILYRGQFESLGIETIYALSQGSAPGATFHGRVTDYLRTLPIDWRWKSTDFYLCGNPEMIREVIYILREGHGVSRKAIHSECFATRMLQTQKKLPTK